MTLDSPGRGEYPLLLTKRALIVLINRVRTIVYLTDHETFVLINNTIVSVNTEK